MTEEKDFDWCDYEVRVSSQGPGLSMVQNGSFRGHAATVGAYDGFKFPQKGQDEVLWLVRGDIAQKWAERTDNRIVGHNAELEVDPVLGLHLHKDVSALRPGDGFVLLKIGALCEPGPIDQEEGFPRPTFREGEPIKM